MTLWQELEGNKYFSNIDQTIHRVIEDQAGSALRSIVENQEDAETLEEIIDEQKPIAKKENSKGKLHHLLYTPMRYPPLKGGGRFHKRHETSIFYGAYDIETALAERAYITFRFNKAAGLIEEQNMSHLAFQIPITTNKGIYLCRDPFVKHKSKICNPLDYNLSQQLGTEMREAGVEAFVYFSARENTVKDKEVRKLNIGVINNEAFAKNTVDIRKSWNAYITPQTIEFTSSLGRLSAKQTFIYKYTDYLINGTFPTP